MRHARTNVRILLVGIVAGLLGTLLWITAFSYARPSAHTLEYSFGFFNATEAPITDLQLSWTLNGATNRVSAGALPSNLGRHSGGVEWMFQPRPIPQRVSLRWRAADHSLHETSVEIASTIREPLQFAGTIWIDFNASGVQVIPMANDEQERLAHQQRPIIPSTAPASQGADADIIAIEDAITRLYLWSRMPQFLPPDEVSYGTDDATREWLASASEYARSVHALSEAVIHCLGKTPLLQLGLSFPSAERLELSLRDRGDKFLGAIDTSRVHVTGSRAEIDGLSNGFGALHATREAGDWKVGISKSDFESVFVPRFPAGEGSPKLLTEESVVYARIALEVTAGKLTTAKQIAAELEGALGGVRRQYKARAGNLDEGDGEPRK